MSYTVVNDVSMLFDESNVAIIPLDKNFEPEFKECQIYTSIFKVSYSECKRDFMYSKNPRKCYVYPIGVDRYIAYVVDLDYKEESMNEIVSVLRRYLSSSQTISLLVKDTSDDFVRRFCNKIPFNLKVYDRAICM